MIQTLEFRSTIHAPVELVWHTMLDPLSYREWTSAFTPGSHYDGSWEQGAPIRFLDGKGGGMVAEIAENRLFQYLSIRHLGYVVDGMDDTESEQVRAWAPAYENYEFRALGPSTELRVRVDVEPSFVKLMNDLWPPALERLRELCESGSEGQA